MIYATCYFLIIGTDIKFNHTNSAIHSSGHSHSLLTSASDCTSAQWRLVLHILVTCSPHVNKCWVTRAIYGIYWGRSHWPITIQHVQKRMRWVEEYVCGAATLSTFFGVFSAWGLKLFIRMSREPAWTLVIPLNGSCNLLFCLNRDVFIFTGLDFKLWNWCQSHVIPGICYRTCG